MKKLTYLFMAPVFTLASIAPAFACYTVKVDNQSDHDIKVIWEAAGCAGMEHWTALTCEYRTVKAGSSESYDYNWGTTTPAVVAYEKVDAEDFLEHPLKYYFRSGKFVTSSEGKASSPSKCGKHYTISFTQQDWDENFR